MNKPKSTKIELTAIMVVSAHNVMDGQAERIAVPGEYKVYREGGKIYLEVFHNDEAK